MLIATGDAVGDALITGQGDDTVSAGDGADWIVNESGNDSIDGGGGNDTIFSGDTGSSLAGGAGDDAIIAGNGADTINGGTGANWLVGGGGDDLFISAGGADTMRGGDGFDTADFSSLGGPISGDLVNGIPALSVGFSSIEKLIGTGFDDTLGGSFAGAYVAAGGGDDIIWAVSATDTLDGGAGTDMAVLLNLGAAAMVADLSTGRRPAIPSSLSISRTS